ncbi:MAG: methyltransferase domain-containing protein [Vicinamibacterales bacterium]
MATAWNPDQYLRFAEPRLRPALDLMGRLVFPDGGPTTVVDLGCGTGSVTALLMARWPAASVTGIDNSAEMLARAAAAVPAGHWVEAPVDGWTAPDGVDLAFSNAALHWLPDHGTLFPHLATQVRSGGRLAVQMPRNFAAPSHTGIAETARSGPWRARLEPLIRETPVLTPAQYYAALQPFGDVDIWETEYLQVLHGPDPVKEWTKGTWLRPFLAALDGSERDAFEAEYAARMRDAYPARADGTTLFPFRRLFIVLRRG